MIQVAVYASKTIVSYRKQVPFSLILTFCKGAYYDGSLSFHISCIHATIMLIYKICGHVLNANEMQRSDQDDDD